MCVFWCKQVKFDVLLNGVWCLLRLQDTHIDCSFSKREGNLFNVWVATCPEKTCLAQREKGKGVWVMHCFSYWTRYGSLIRSVVQCLCPRSKVIDLLCNMEFTTCATAGDHPLMRPSHSPSHTEWTGLLMYTFSLLLLYCKLRDMWTRTACNTTPPAV